MSELTAERLRELLHYNAETGVFTWKARVAHRVQVGDVAGHRSKAHGYVVFSIGNKLYRAHRLAWLYCYGVWPSKNLDHANGNRADNRICNLRDVEQGVNNQNRRSARSDNKSGLLGVEVTTARTYQARITFNGNRMSLGTYQTPEEAHQAYLAAKRRLHPGCTI